jgi:hypothetical protein
MFITANTACLVRDWISLIRLVDIDPELGDGGGKAGRCWTGRRDLGLS